MLAERITNVIELDPVVAGGVRSTGSIDAAFARFASVSTSPAIRNRRDVCAKSCARDPPFRAATLRPGARAAHAERATSATVLLVRRRVDTVLSALRLPECAGIRAHSSAANLVAADRPARPAVGGARARIDACPPARRPIILALAHPGDTRRAGLTDVAARPTVEAICDRVYANAIAKVQAVAADDFATTTRGLPRTAVVARLIVGTFIVRIRSTIQPGIAASRRYPDEGRHPVVGRPKVDEKFS